MKTHFQKTIFKFIFLMLMFLSSIEDVLATNNPDVQVLATLPSGPSDHDGILDLVINAGTPPYLIKYLKDDGSGQFNLVHEVQSSGSGEEDFLDAEFGNYQIEIQDAHCGILILNVTISENCNCVTPVLNYSPENCYLSWDEMCNELGTGNIYSLQKEMNGDWADVSISEQFHYPQTDGNYRIKISKPGCVDVFSNIVNVTCGSTSVACLCPTPSISYSAEDCKIYWTTSGCAGFLSSIQKKNQNDNWENVSSSSSPFSIPENGEYRLVLSKAGCSDQVLSNVISATCITSNPCACTPVITYNSNNCQFSFSASGCEGFTTELLKLSSENTWLTVQFAPTFPYTPPANGTYKLLLNKSGCTNIESAPISALCGNTTCECNDPVLNYDDNVCQLAWTGPNCPGYYSILQKFSNGVWTDLNNSSPYLVGTTNNGQFRIKSTKPGCNTKYSNIKYVTCSCQSLMSIDAYYMAGLGQNSAFNIPFNGSNTIFLSQLTPTGCSSTTLQLGFPSSQIDNTWSFTGSNLTVEPNGTANGYFTIDIAIPTDPNNNEGVLYIQNICGDIYSINIINDCCMNINLIGDVTRGCGSLNLDVINGTSPYTFTISGNGSMGTPIEQFGSVIDMSSLQQGEEITLSVIISDNNGCTLEYSIHYKKCNYNCTTAPDGSEICECFSMDGIGFSEESCSVDNYAIGCEPEGNVHIYNSNGELIGSESLNNYEESLSNLNEIISTNGNDDYTVIAECDCGYSIPVSLNVSCLGSKLTGFSDLTRDNFTFYPNPFKTGIYIKSVLNSDTNLKMLVYNNLGSLIFTKNIEFLNGQNVYYIEEFENYPSGMFTIKLFNDKSDIMYRIVKIE